MKLKFISEDFNFTLNGKAVSSFEKAKAFADYTKRGLIIRDGRIVDNEAYLRAMGASENQKRNNAHRDVDMVLCQDIGVSDKRKERRGIDDSGDIMTQLCDQLGYVRVNGDNEDYISLPDSKPTSSQYYAIVDWIDNFFAINNQRPIRVTTAEGHQVEYDPKNPPADVDYIDGKYVVDRIKDFYTRGTLLEKVDKE